MKKNYSELSFTDDFMFCKVLVSHPNLCKELLELLLGIEIKKIEMAESQKTIEMTYDGKGIRFDVYTEDEKNTVYNIEMQTTSQKDLPKRSRYYQGMVDLNLIERGAKFKQLKNSYIIFICLDDPFGYNLPIYTFRNYCQQNKEIELGDATAKVIINAKGSREGLSDDMIAFLDFISENKTNSEFTKKIKQAVNDAIEHKEWEVEYMTMYAKLQEAEERGAITERISSGRDYNIPDKEIAEKLMLKFQLTEEEAYEEIKKYDESLLQKI